MKVELKYSGLLGCSLSAAGNLTHQDVPLKSLDLLNCPLHSVTSQKTRIFNTNAVETSDFAIRNYYLV